MNAGNLKAIEFILNDRSLIEEKLKCLDEKYHSISLVKSKITDGSLREKLTVLIQKILDAKKTGSLLSLKTLIQCFFDKIIIHPDNRLELVINLGLDFFVHDRRQKFVNEKNGSGGGTRTPDQAVNSRLLYRLSYS